MTAFARSRSVHPSTFRQWLRRAEEPPPPTFLEVVPGRGQEDGLQVRIEGHELRFGELPSPGWFAEVVRELSRC